MHISPLVVDINCNTPLHKASLYLYGHRECVEGCNAAA